MPWDYLVSWPISVVRRNSMGRGTPSRTPHRNGQATSPGDLASSLRPVWAGEPPLPLPSAARTLHRASWLPLCRSAWALGPTPPFLPHVGLGPGKFLSHLYTCLPVAPPGKQTQGRQDGLQTETQQGFAGWVILASRTQDAARSLTRTRRPSQAVPAQSFSRDGHKKRQRSMSGYRDQDEDESLF